MRPVTDPALLSQLEKPPAPITDPALIKKLDGDSERSFLGHASDVVFGGPAAVGEVGLQMATGLFAALPGAAAGVYEAAKGGEYSPAFKFVQGEYTYEPRTDYGKKAAQGIGDLFHKYSGAVDSVADKTPGGPIAQTAVKTAGEAVPLVAPFLIGRGRAPKPEASGKPVTDPATIEALERPAERPAESPGIDLRPPETPKAAPVEDPALIARLEAVEPQALGAQAPKPVTDPVVLSELNKFEPFADIPGQRDLAVKRVTDPETVAKLEAAPEHVFDIRERQYKPPQIDLQNDSITSAVTKLGGLRTDFAQDIPAIGAMATRDVRGFQFMVKKNGKTADEIAGALHERGYLESRDINELFEKLDSEISSGKATHFSNRQNVDTYMERLMEEKYGPAGQLYSGLPLDRLGDTVNYANRKLGDTLGIPEKGVTVELPPFQKKPGFIDLFRSPSQLVNKFPALKPFKSAADKAQVDMDTLRDAFGRRLVYVDRQLGGGVAKLADLGKDYKANKTQLNEILVSGDFLGKRFTRAELKAQFDAPEGVINAYEGLRSAYDHALTLANKAREVRGKEPIAKREGYIPHFFHDYFIVADGQILASARTLREAVEMGNDAARSGAAVRVVPKQMRFPDEEMQAAVVGDATYIKLREGIEDAFSMTTDQAKMLLEDIARMRGRSRMVGNFFQRKGAPGWEKNLDYSHRHYFNMISRYVALDKFKASTITNFEHRFGPFDKEHKGIAKYIKDYVNDINGVPSRAEELMDNALKGVPGFSQAAALYLGSRPSLELASATTNAVAIAKLGLYNVSSALVNGSQTIMSQALIGPRWFAEGAKRAAVVTAELGKRKLGFQGATTQDIGLLRQMDVPVQQGLESGAGYSKFSQAGKLFSASTAFFRGVEFELRATTALGAYYKALAEGATKEQAITYGRESNRRVNFDYSIADAPAILRRTGPLGQVMGQFKKFPIKAMEFMATLKGAENARFWIPFVLISGYYGFPGVEVMNNLVKGMFGIDLQLETKDYLIRWAGDDPQKKAVAKTIFYGAFANDALGGVDVSRRIGGGDFIPSQFNDLFGPFFSSTIRAAQMAAGEHWIEAMRAISSAPGNIALAIRNEGEITNPWDRDRLTVKLDTRGRILKALGFGSVQESAQRDVARVIRYNEHQQREEEKKALDKFISAYQENDQASMDKAISRFAELGMGEGTGERIRGELFKKGIPVSERAFYNLPRKGMARELPMLDFAK